MTVLVQIEVKRAELTKVWFDEAPKTQSVFVDEDKLQGIIDMIDERTPAGLFFFDPGDTKYVLELYSDLSNVFRVIQVRGHLVIEDEKWYVVEKSPVEVFEGLLQSAPEETIDIGATCILLRENAKHSGSR